MQVDVSLILTCYNFRAFLRMAVESLLAQQTSFNFELLVIDDASPDRSLEEIADLADPRLIRFALPKNIGAAQAINLGFAHARGRYVARLDGDDRWYPEFVQQCAARLDSDPEIGMVYCEVDSIDAAGVTQPETLIGPHRASAPPSGDEFAALLHRHYTCAPGILYRREAWQAILPWPERFSSALGDWYCNLTIAARWKVAFVPRTLASYRMHGGGMHLNSVRSGLAERNTRLILEHFLGTEQLAARAPSMQSLLADHLLGFGDAYFGCDMVDDARRCYLEAGAKRPWRLLRARHRCAFVGSLIGKARYEKLKKLLKRGT